MTTSLVERLERAVDACRPAAAAGRVATYISELSRQPTDGLAVALVDADGVLHEAGDADLSFTMQSISKILALALALEELGSARVFARVGMEPTADPFNSIMRLEMIDGHRPQNPFINAGAIVVNSLLPYRDARSRSQAVLDLARRMSGNEAIEVDEAVYDSERGCSDRNRALAYFLKSVHSFSGDVEDVLEGYFRQCAISLRCRDMAEMAAVLAFDGCRPGRDERILSSETCQILRALMATCGMYDGSGEAAVRCGIPAKSGVGGGILAASKGRAGLGIVAPALDEKGNPVAGLQLFERLSTEFDLRVY